jgi:hypothetical protein
MPGERDHQEYVRARRTLLDALEALAEQLDAIVLVGAQAIYLHTGNADLTVAEFTTDADVAIHPADLNDSPLLGEALAAQGFTAQEDLGRWLSSDGVYVDIMVPDTLAGPGTRGARLGPHGKRGARRARGLEGALVDRAHQTIGALEPTDTRSATLWVAGPGALLVAKTHKIAERAGDPGRARDKDALDVLRLLRAVPTATMIERLRLLADDEHAGPVTAEARTHVIDLFGTRDAEGVVMAVRAAGSDEVSETIASSMIVLVGDLLDSWQ